MNTYEPLSEQSDPVQVYIGTYLPLCDSLTAEWLAMEIESGHFTLCPVCHFLFTAPRPCGVCSQVAAAAENVLSGDGLNPAELLSAGTDLKIARHEQVENLYSLWATESSAARHIVFTRMARPLLALKEGEG